MRAVIMVFVLTSVFLGSASPQSNEGMEVLPLPLIIAPESVADVSYVHTKNKHGEVTSANVLAELSVHAERDDGFIATWMTKSIAVGDVLIDEKNPQAANLYIGIPFKFVASFDGEPVRIFDRKHLLGGLLSNPVFADTEEDIVQAVVELFQSMSDEGLASTFVKVPYYMSICQSTSLPQSQKVESRGEVASPFGEGSLVGFTSYELTTIDDELGVARIEYQSGYDPESMTELVIDVFQRLAPDKMPTQEEIDQLSITQSTQAICDIDVETGWVSEMKLTNLVGADGEFQSEEFQISVSWTE